MRAVSTRLCPRLSLANESLRVCITVKPFTPARWRAGKTRTCLRDPDGGAEHPDGIDRLGRILA